MSTITLARFRLICREVAGRANSRARREAATRETILRELLRAVESHAGRRPEALRAGPGSVTEIGVALGRLVGRKSESWLPIAQEELLAKVLIQAEPERPRPKDSHAAPEVRALDGLVILVIEDDDGLGVTDLLVGRGAHVITTRTAFGAIEMMRFVTPDLLISNFNRPVARALDLIEHVRTLPHGTAVRAIALTEPAQGADHTAVLEAGFFDRLDLPVAPDALLAAIGT